MTAQQPFELAADIRQCLTENILPYWLKYMTDPDGGYYGRRDGEDRLHPEAERGAILNARILWSFAAAYPLTGDPQHLDAARRAFDYITSRFVDPEFGGVYWSLNPDGTPADTKKQTYAIAFTIYGLAEYARVADEPEAPLALAMSLFRDIEENCLDKDPAGGYLEALTRDWKAIGDMRLSDKDRNACKTMNTHLHILEAYTALHRVAPLPEVKAAVRRLVDIMLHRILDPATHHLGLFFDRDWTRLDAEISYGHDIEASWLILEAAREIASPQDEDFYSQVLDATGRIAMAAMQGYCTDGSMIYERHASGRYDNEKHWWVQAETLVGLLWLAKYHPRYPLAPNPLDLAAKTWEYISRNLLDTERGEWYWSRFADGSINRRDDKAGFWKCPYHNSRMCLQALALLK